MTISMLDELNYRSWMISIKSLLKQQDLWEVVVGTGRIPRLPARPAETIAGTDGTTARRVVYPPPNVGTLDFEPELEDNKACMTKYWRVQAHDCMGKPQVQHEKSQRTIYVGLNMAIRHRYSDDKYGDPTVLWNAIKNEFQEESARWAIRVSQANHTPTGRLRECSGLDRGTGQDHRESSHLRYQGRIWRKHYIISNLSCQWNDFKTMLHVSGKGGTVATTLYPKDCEAQVQRDKSISADTALFVTKKGKGQKPTGKGSGNTGTNGLTQDPRRNSKENALDVARKVTAGPGRVGGRLIRKRIPEKISEKKPEPEQGRGELEPGGEQHE